MRETRKRRSSARPSWLGAIALVLAILGPGCNLEDITSILPPANLVVTTTTTGNNSTLGGYRVAIEGPELKLSRDIGANASVRFVIVAKEQLTVELRNVPSNCAVDANPQAVLISTESESEVTFKVACR